jgi:hypothetical protein
MASRKDEMLGRLAIDRGMLNDKQLEECRRAQLSVPSDPNMTIGRGQLKPLGSVMLEKGFLNAQQLTELMEEQTRRLNVLELYETMVKAEMNFGQLLVTQNKVTQNQINKCLEIQRRLAEKGTMPIPTLAQLLVEHGYCDQKSINDILSMSLKDRLLCTNCGKQFNVIGIEPGKTYKCKACGGVMITPTMLEGMKADETTFGFNLPSDKKPPA